MPQDVEAEDKLLGPLSFRQFIYAMIALAGAALAYFLATMIAMPLAVIPLPIILVFATLAIPRRGQPMEIYIGALIHFYFFPNKRLWNPDDQENLVEITNPVIDTEPLTKEVGGAEAARRLSFLADIEDTQGWSTRGNVNLNDDFALAANMALDVFDDISLNEEFSEKLAETDKRVREEAIARMDTAITTPVAPTPPVAAPVAPTIVTPPPTAPIMPAEDEAALSAMLKQSSATNSMTTFQQTVIQPLSASPAPNSSTPTPPPASEPIEPDIIEERGNTTDIGTEEIILHDSEDNDNQSGEISLH